MVLTIKLKKVVWKPCQSIVDSHPLPGFVIINVFSTYFDRSQSHLEPVMRLLVAMATYTQSSQWS